MIGRLWLVVFAGIFFSAGCDSASICIPLNPDYTPTYVDVWLDNNGNLFYDNECDSWDDFDAFCVYTTIEWCCADYTTVKGREHYDSMVDLHFANCGLGWQLIGEYVDYGLCDFSCEADYDEHHHW